jgi:hypothetical protein
MRKYAYFYTETPPNDIDPLELVWNNLKVADETLNLMCFCSLTSRWFDLSPGKNFQDFEKELRERDFNTHLFVSIPPENIKHQLRLRKSDTPNSEYKYRCMFSCRPKDAALQEVIQATGSSYESNFENLEFAASIHVDENENLESDAQRILPLEHDLTTTMQNDNCVLKYDMLEIRDYVARMKDVLVEKYDDTVDWKLLGVEDGKLYYGANYKDTIVSMKGICIGREGNSLVDLNMSS